MIESGRGSYRPSDYEIVKTAAMVRLMRDPLSADAAGPAVRHHLGCYVPEGYKLPLGDNRDGMVR